MLHVDLVLLAHIVISWDYFGALPREVCVEHLHPLVRADNAVYARFRVCVHVCTIAWYRVAEACLLLECKFVDLVTYVHM